MQSVTAQELQHRVEDRIRAWSVVVEHTIETESALLAFGHRGAQPVVVKVLRSQGDEWRSGEVLAAFEGRGVVRVYEYVTGALLLERFRPGTPLVQLALAGQDDDATDVLADVLGAMAPRPSLDGFLPVQAWAAGFERYAASGDDQIPKALLAEATRLYSELCDSQSRPRLLHGDLQHYNILYDTQRGWLAIDPKGIVGELEYELGACLRNPYERPDLFAESAIVEKRLRRLSAKLGFDPVRALSWGFAQAVLSAIWTVEDGFPVDAQHPSLMLAQAIRPMLGALS